MVTNNSNLSAIYNDGERLVPGETHDREEVIRHKSSYQFFYRIIESDILNNPSILTRGIKILDVGSGTGHGTFMLSKLPGVKVTGIEPGLETVKYARENYAADNLTYINSDLESYVGMGEKYDYVVSRHALEHVVAGLDMVLEIPVSMRLMVNVPFNEDDRNPFHLVHWIDENSFVKYRNREFFYESMAGETSIKREIESPPNSIVCVSSADALENVSDLFSFPLPPWRPDFLQERGLSSIGHDLSEIQSKLIVKEADLTTREADLTTREADLESRENRLISCIHEREQEVEKREQVLEARIAAFESSKSVKLLRAVKILR